MNPTEAQQRAIDSDASNILVVAGPGSGKTATTVRRIRRLIDTGVNPSNIVAITYTNAAAKEIAHRISLGNEVDDVPYRIALGFVGTLHGFALKMLKQYGDGMGYGQRISVVGEEAAADLLASKAQSLGCKIDVKKLLKIKGEVSGNAPSPRMSAEERVIRSYYAELRESGMVDFDTILTEFLRMAQAWHELSASNGHPLGSCFTHLFVDEVQDSALIDWMIYEAIPIANKFFCGDSDQSLYGFRGGRPDIMEAYSRRPYVETHLLQENFRSHSEICEAAQRLIEHNTERIAKQTLSVNGPGGRITHCAPMRNTGEETACVAHSVEDQLSYGVKPSEIAVLARTNDICAEVREQLKVSGIPVAEEAKTDLPQDWTLAKALVELLVNPENDTLAMFYLRAKGRSVADVHEVRRSMASEGKTINRLLGFRTVKLNDLGKELAEQGVSLESMMRVASIIRRLPAGSDLMQLALAVGQDQGEQTSAVQGVVVTTLHGSKGREFDTVFLVGCEDEILPGNRKNEDVSEARRLAYVGITRARKQVFLSYSLSRRTSWGAMESHKASRFIKEAGL